MGFPPDEHHTVQQYLLPQCRESCGPLASWPTTWCRAAVQLYVWSLQRLGSLTLFSCTSRHVGHRQANISAGARNGAQPACGRLH